MNLITNMFICTQQKTYTGVMHHVQVERGEEEEQKDDADRQLHRQQDIAARMRRFGLCRGHSAKEDATLYYHSVRISPEPCAS